MSRDESFSSQPYASPDPRGLHPNVRPKARRSNRISPFQDDSPRQSSLSPGVVPDFSRSQPMESPRKTPHRDNSGRPATVADLRHMALLSNLNSTVRVDDEDYDEEGWDASDEETNQTLKLGAKSPYASGNLNQSVVSLPGSSRPLSLVSDSNPPDYLVWDLSISTGLLTPAFSPYRHVYVLLVPPSTTQILLNGHSPLGDVLVDKHDSRIPVDLLPPGHGSQKVVVSVKAPPGYHQHNTFPIDSFQYVIDVRRESVSFNGPPPTSNPPSHDMESNAGVVDPHQQRYIVQYPFEAATEREMSLQPGDSVVVLLKSDSGWWGGVQTHDTSKEGWFPSTHVKPQPTTHLGPLGSKTPNGVGTGDDPFAYSNLFVTHHKPPDDYSTKFSANGGKSQHHHHRHNHKKRYPGHFPGKQFVVVHLPIFTVTMMIINIIMFIVGISKDAEDLEVNPMLGPDYDTLIELGARNFEDTHDEGRVYLFFTAIFLPVGLFRLLFDLVFHWVVCAPFERVYGPLVTAFVYFTSGIAGHLFGMLALPEWTGAGPAPALMGISAAFLVILVSSWYLSSFKPRLEILFIFFWILGSMVLGIFPGTDNWTQVGGFIAGLLAGLFVLSQCRPSYQIGRISFFVRVALTFIGLVGLFLFIALEFVLLYSLIDVDDACEWCKEATCLDRFDWCNAYRLGRVAQE